MERDPSKPSQEGQLIQLVGALEEMRDSFMVISLALKDLVTETPSAARDEVLTEVERYLNRMREGSRKNFE
jgi:hypothetical protein